MLRDVAAPRPGPGQAVVDVSVIPVLFLDTQIRQGAAKDWFPTTPPYVPGSGVAGTVTAVGEGVQPEWVNRNVVGATQGGSYVEVAIAPVDSLVEIPPGLGMAEAAALLTDGRTAVGLIEMADRRSLWNWMPAATSWAVPTNHDRGPSSSSRSWASQKSFCS